MTDFLVAFIDTCLAFDPPQWEDALRATSSVTATNTLSVAQATAIARCTSIAGRWVEANTLVRLVAGHSPPPQRLAAHVIRAHAVDGSEAAVSTGLALANTWMTDNRTCDSSAADLWRDSVIRIACAGKGVNERVAWDTALRAMQSAPYPTQGVAGASAAQHAKFCEKFGVTATLPGAASLRRDESLRDVNGRMHSLVLAGRWCDALNLFHSTYDRQMRSGGSPSESATVGFNIALSAVLLLNPSTHARRLRRGVSSAAAMVKSGAVRPNHATTKALGELVLRNGRWVLGVELLQSDVLATHHRVASVWPILRCIVDEGHWAMALRWYLQRANDFSGVAGNRRISSMLAVGVCKHAPSQWAVAIRLVDDPVDVARLLRITGRL